MSYVFFKNSYNPLMRCSLFLPRSKTIYSSCNSRCFQNMELKNSRERHFDIKRPDLSAISFVRGCSSTGKPEGDDQCKEKLGAMVQVNPYSKPIPPDASKIRRYYFLFEKYLYLTLAASLDFYKAVRSSNEWKLIKLTAIKLYNFVIMCIQTYILPMVKKWFQNFKENVNKARREDVNKS